MFSMIFIFSSLRRSASVNLCLENKLQIELVSAADDRQCASKVRSVARVDEQSKTHPTSDCPRTSTAQA